VCNVPISEIPGCSERTGTRPGYLVNRALTKNVGPEIDKYLWCERWGLGTLTWGSNIDPKNLNFKNRKIRCRIIYDLNRIFANFDEFSPTKKNVFVFTSPLYLKGKPFTQDVI